MSTAEPENRRYFFTENEAGEITSAVMIDTTGLPEETCAECDAAEAEWAAQDSDPGEPWTGPGWPPGWVEVGYTDIGSEHPLIEKPIQTADAIAPELLAAIHKLARA